MSPDDSPPAGTVRLFHLLGIPVYLHWSWGLVALVELQWRSTSYGSWLYNAVEYVLLFTVVLLHELGHATACRSVGGEAHRILLWPLGGIAYVKPPPRPGAQLWSIVAGPLVNVVLAILAVGVWAVAPPLGPDVARALETFIAINILLFLFNVLPIYPLDGGQIVRSILWFFVGPIRSLIFAAGLGLAASVLGGLAAVQTFGSVWIGIIAAYAAWHSWNALKLALEVQARVRERHAAPPS